MDESKWMDQASITGKGEKGRKYQRERERQRQRQRDRGGMRHNGETRLWEFEIFLFVVVLYVASVRIAEWFFQSFQVSYFFPNLWRCQIFLSSLNKKGLDNICSTPHAPHPNQASRFQRCSRNWFFWLFFLNSCLASSYREIRLSPEYLCTLE